MVTPQLKTATRQTTSAVTDLDSFLEAYLPNTNGGRERAPVSSELIGNNSMSFPLIEDQPCEVKDRPVSSLELLFHLITC